MKISCRLELFKVEKKDLKYFGLLWILMFTKVIGTPILTDNRLTWLCKHTTWPGKCPPLFTSCGRSRSFQIGPEDGSNDLTLLLTIGRIFFFLLFFCENLTPPNVVSVSLPLNLSPTTPPQVTFFLSHLTYKIRIIMYELSTFCHQPLLTINSPVSINLIPLIYLFLFFFI